MQNALGEHSAILSTFIKLPFIFKPFVLPIFEWPLNTGFTVVPDQHAFKMPADLDLYSYQNRIVFIFSLVRFSFVYRILSHLKCLLNLLPK